MSGYKTQTKMVLLAECPKDEQQGIEETPGLRVPCLGGELQPTQVCGW